jgi:acyl carrier protein
MAFNSDEMLAYFSENFGLDVDDIDDETLLFSDGYLDSFAIVDVVVYLESANSISINPSEVSLDNLDSIGRMASFVEAKTA